MLLELGDTAHMKPARVKLLTLGRWCFSPLPAHTTPSSLPPNLTVPSPGNASLDLQAKGNSCDAVCQLLKSQTCSGCSGTNRNRQITAETGANAHLILNTNKQNSAWRQHGSSEMCVRPVCLFFFFRCLIL